MKRLILTAMIATTLAACATNPDKIASAYVPPSEYDGFSCQELEVAYKQNTNEYRELFTSMKKRNNTNTGAAVVGAILFWPALFLMKGKDAEADGDLAELKGREKALITAMSNCDTSGNTLVSIEELQRQAVEEHRAEGCQVVKDEIKALHRTDKPSNAMKREYQKLCTEEG